MQTTRALDPIGLAAEPIIAIDHVNHYFGSGRLRKQVLFDITARIEPGEVVILMGPSGSGKTTLLTLIGALRSTQEGSLKLFQEELYKANNGRLVNLRRSIGYIFQAHNLLNALTSQQNVQMTLDLQPQLGSREKKLRALDMLDAVGLKDWANYYPSQLSGGQKQRVAIARALVGQPKIVLADEPTAALDKKSGREVVEIMRQLAQQQGSAVLLVTHDNRILDVADRILYMEDGYLKEMDRDRGSDMAGAFG
ncbi:MAG: ATP-binding cassette domain-containing protein [Synechococcales cyanobacterium CRU_2_2]|nr:ATP-binding cassette domain-containing protein [Synechococcales cyanobacterium CRU_2_2]